MIRITASLASDIPQIREWLEADNWHRDDPRNDPSIMITGYGLFSFCLQDEKGPLVYVKLTEEEKLVRIAMQFAPESVVSKRRLIVGLAKVGIPVMIEFAQDAGYKGLVFESVNPSLIGFGIRLGFKSIGNNDFAMFFEDTADV